MSQNFKIVIETFLRPIELMVNDSNTILNIKTMIEKIEGINSSQQDLYFENEILNNDKSLSDYGITANNQLSLMIKVDNLNQKELSIEDLDLLEKIMNFSP